MSNHATCPICKDYTTPLDTIEGICSRCFVKKEKARKTIDNDKNVQYDGTTILSNKER